MKIGAFPDLSIAEARNEVIALKNKVAKGGNPAAEKSRLAKEITFKELFDKYINDYAKHNTKSWKDDIAEMDRKAKFLYHTKISKIKREDINKLFNSLTMTTGKGGANRFLDRLRAVFNKAIEWGWEGKNPTDGIKKHKQKSRDRYLTSEEIPRFFKAFEEEDNQIIKDFILTCLFTGARKSNVLAMRWDNISLVNRTWYIPETKNGEPQLIPLVNEVMTVLERRNESKAPYQQWVFPSKNSSSGHLQEPKKVWLRILKNSGIKDFRLHDLRRTLGSWMAHLGASQYVIGKGLNHKSPKSTAVYARLSIDPVREFMGKASSAMNKIRDAA